MFWQLQLDGKMCYPQPGYPWSEKPVEDCHPAVQETLLKAGVPDTQALYAIMWKLFHEWRASFGSSSCSTSRPTETARQWKVTICAEGVCGDQHITAPWMVSYWGFINFVHHIPPTAWLGISPLYWSPLRLLLAHTGRQTEVGFSKDCLFHSTQFKREWENCIPG